MKRSQNYDRAEKGSAPPLIVGDLCAQLTPLNRYGLPDLLGVAIAGSFRALVGVSRAAVAAVLPSEREVTM